MVRPRPTPGKGASTRRATAVGRRGPPRPVRARPVLAPAAWGVPSGPSRTGVSGDVHTGRTPGRAVVLGRGGRGVGRAGHRSGRVCVTPGDATPARPTIRVRRGLECRSPPPAGGSRDRAVPGRGAAGGATDTRPRPSAGAGWGRFDPAPPSRPRRRGGERRLIPARVAAAPLPALSDPPGLGQTRRGRVGGNAGRCQASMPRRRSLTKYWALPGQRDANCRDAAMAGGAEARGAGS